MQGAIESGLRAAREVNDADAPVQARVEAGDLARALAGVEAGDPARASMSHFPVWRG